MSTLHPLLALLFCLPVAAQGLWLQPGPDDNLPGSRARPTANGVRIDRTSVRVEIVDGVATTQIEQVLRNGAARDAEAIWFLPLPEGAVADSFVMTVGGKEIAGEVLDANRARGVYEQIVRQRRDPGLLEYAGEGLLRARIFPIPAHGEVSVAVRLRAVLQPLGGMYRWCWPLRVARFGDVDTGALVLDVVLRSTPPLGTVLAPYATADIQRTGEHEARVSMELARPQLLDLEVLYGLRQQEFGLHILPWRQGTEPGTFAMLLSPPRQLADAEAPRRCVQFVVDTSGSMAGQKLQQAQASLRAFLRSLRPDDWFQVVSFATAVQSFFDAPRPATAANVAAALQRVDGLRASGGTDIGEALRTAFAATLPAAAGSLLQQIVFVTDGQPTVGQTRPEQILELVRTADHGGMRLFAFGVGDDVDARLIDDLVRQHRGAREFVRGPEKIDARVEALCQKLAQPALCDVVVSFPDLDAFDVQPTRTRDLFCGEVLQVVGRYRNPGVHQVRVHGVQNGVDRDYIFQVDFPAVAGQYPFVPTLWARQQVAFLLGEIRRQGQVAELVTEVRRLALQYGIVTPYTSQLIVEEGRRLATGQGAAAFGTDAGESAFDSNQWNSAVGISGGAGGAYGGRAGGRAKLAEEPDPDAAQPSTPAAPSRQLREFGRARTGAEAIEESVVSDESGKQLGGRDRTGLVRHAAGRTFVVVGATFVEQGLPADWAKTAVVIETFSPAWFELSKQQPQLSPVLALGERVVFKDGERIVQVKPAVPPEKAPEKATPPAEPAPDAGRTGR